MRHPVLAEQPFVHVVNAVILNRLEPDKLKIEIIVRRRVPFEVLRVERHVENLPFSLHRSAKRSADVLPGPAAEHLVAVLPAVDETVSRFVGMKHRNLSFRYFVSASVIISKIQLLPFFRKEEKRKSSANYRKHDMIPFQNTISK